MCICIYFYIYICVRYRPHVFIHKTVIALLSFLCTFFCVCLTIPIVLKTVRAVFFRSSIGFSRHWNWHSMSSITIFNCSCWWSLSQINTLDSAGTDGCDFFFFFFSLSLMRFILCVAGFLHTLVIANAKSRPSTHTHTNIAKSMESPIRFAVVLDFIIYSNSKIVNAGKKGLLRIT